MLLKTNDQIYFLKRLRINKHEEQKEQRIFRKRFPPKSPVEHNFYYYFFNNIFYVRKFKNYANWVIPEASTFRKS